MQAYTRLPKSNRQVVAIHGLYVHIEASQNVGYVNTA